MSIALPIEEIETPTLLLDSAEKLIAEQGIDRVSIRAINAAAGRSPSAVRYHFRDKESLVMANVERRMGPSSEERTRLAAEIRAERTPTAHDLAELIVRPLAIVRRREPWGRDYVAFLAALLRGGPEWQELMRKPLALQSKLVRSVIAEALPQFSPQVAEFRLWVLGRGVLMTLAELEDSFGFWADCDDPEEAAIAGLVDCYATGLNGVHDPT
jgi:AcrR family transcriptional regulator